MSKFISIIGSRKTPDDILLKIEEIAEFFAKKGWVLRSGGANGADTAGYNGFKKVKGSKAEIYVPWNGYNNIYNGILWSKLNWDEAANHHPIWDNLDVNVKCLHARNMSIILGVNNNLPSNLVVCWTPDGKEIGGTATGLSCSKKYKVPIFNLGKKNSLTKLRKFCKESLK